MRNGEFVTSGAHHHGWSQSAGSRDSGPDRRSFGKSDAFGLATWLENRISFYSGARATNPTPKKEKERIGQVIVSRRVYRSYHVVFFSWHAALTSTIGT